MLDKTFGLLFYLKKPKNFDGGLIPIYMRITVDGVPGELSIKRSWQKTRWNASAGRAAGTKEDAKALNVYIDTFKAKVFEAKRQLIEKNKAVTTVAIKDAISGTGQRGKMLMAIFDDYNKRVHKLIGIDYAESTWVKYQRTQRFVESFIQYKYGSKDNSIQSLDMQFVLELEVWFKTVRKCKQNTTVKYISILEMIIIHCLDNSWLDSDPFSKFKLIKEEVIPEYLTKEELQLISNKEIKIHRLKQVRDVFLILLLHWAFLY